MDRRLVVWLATLAGLAVLNVGLWLWMASVASPHTPYAEAQLLLSAVYVGVCGFRSLFPRVDLERVCLWDTWLSAIVLGRAAATIAELCFALQCSLFVQRLSDMTGVPFLATAAHAFVPLAVGAEIACWYAVVSLDHVGHALEETLWALIMLVLAAASGAAGLASEGMRVWLLLGAAVIYTIGAGLTLAFDVTMYVGRRRAWATVKRLPLAAGLRDCGVRRKPTRAWEVWREEVAWMTLYFSIGVWTSLAMVILEWA
ncbi:MAG: hypothetical protein ABIT71_20700 [Vicinamibacteraceae bacterium]